MPTTLDNGRRSPARAPTGRRRSAARAEGPRPYAQANAAARLAGDPAPREGGRRIRVSLPPGSN
jgi:hypothetical protein